MVSTCLYKHMLYWSAATHMPIVWSRFDPILLLKHYSLLIQYPVMIFVPVYFNAQSCVSQSLATTKLLSN